MSTGEDQSLALSIEQDDLTEDLPGRQLSQKLHCYDGAVMLGGGHWLVLVFVIVMYILFFAVAIALATTIAFHVWRRLERRYPR